MLVCSYSVFGCDHCNVYLNQSPNDYQNSIGLYMRQRIMFGEFDFFGQNITTLHAGHGNDVALWGKNVIEKYQKFEIRGNYYFRERWKTTVIIPVVNNQQIVGDVKRYQINHIGDPIILQSYQLYNTKKDTSSANFGERLMIGAGIKLPVGKTNLKYEQGIPNLDLQPGTGSWDLLGIVTYGFKWYTFGLVSQFNLKLNGKDQNNYRYGTTINGTVNLFNDFKIKKSTIRIQSGVNIEHALMDASYLGIDQIRTKHENTGGTILFLNAGAQIFLKKLVIFGEFQPMIHTTLNGYSQLYTQSKFNLGITYLL